MAERSSKKKSANGRGDVVGGGRTKIIATNKGYIVFFEEGGEKVEQNSVCFLYTKVL